MANMGWEWAARNRALYSRRCLCAAWPGIQLQTGAAAGFRPPGNMLQSMPVLLSCPCRLGPSARIPHVWGAGHAWHQDRPRMALRQEHLGSQGAPLSPCPHVQCGLGSTSCGHLAQAPQDVDVPSSLMAETGTTVQHAEDLHTICRAAMQ